LHDITLATELEFKLGQRQIVWLQQLQHLYWHFMLTGVLTVDVGAIHQDQFLFYPIKKPKHVSIETVNHIITRGKKGALWIVGVVIIVLS
jgi:hypothetical protein